MLQHRLKCSNYCRSPDLFKQFESQELAADGEDMIMKRVRPHWAAVSATPPSTCQNVPSRR